MTKFDSTNTTSSNELNTWLIGRWFMTLKYHWTITSKSQKKCFFSSIETSYNFSHPKWEKSTLFQIFSFISLIKEKWYLLNPLQNFNFHVKKNVWSKKWKDLNHLLTGKVKTTLPLTYYHDPKPWILIHYINTIKILNIIIIHNHLTFYASQETRIE